MARIEIVLEDVESPEPGTTPVKISVAGMDPEKVMEEDKITPAQLIGLEIVMGLREMNSHIREDKEPANEPGRIILPN